MNGGGFGIKDLVSFTSLGLAIFFGAMWLGSIDTKVSQLEKTSVTDGRISKLEQKVETLNENTVELKSSVKDLVRELRRTP